MNVQIAVSVILPIRDERENLAPVFEELTLALHDIPFEIVAVDDASTDGSQDELRRLRLHTTNLRIVELGAPAGQSGALAVGFDRARGNVIATMDADGQNDPADLPAMLELLDREDCAAVVGYRTSRHESTWRVLQSRLANWIRNRLTRDRIRDTGCSLRLIRRDAVLRLPRFDGMHRFLPTLVRLTGGTVLELEVRHRPRRHGRSKYGMWNRVFVALRDALGVRWLRRRRLHPVVAKEE